MPPIDVLSSFLKGGGSANDPLNLALLRDQQMGEAGDRLVGDVRGGDVRDAAGTGLLLKMLTGDADTDPSTGVVAHQAQAAKEKQFGDAETYTDPRMVDFRHQQADTLQDLEHAKTFGGTMGNVDAGVSTNAEKLAGEAHTRKMEEITGAAAAKAAANPIKLQPRADDALRSIRELAPLVGQLESTIKDPNDNSLSTSASNRMGYWLYSHGIDPGMLGMGDQDRLRIQLAGLIKVLGSSPYAASSRNFQFLKQAQEHLTDPNQTPKMLAEQLKTLKDILPVFQNEILTNETKPATPLNFGALSNGQPSAAPLPQGVTVKQIG